MSSIVTLDNRPDHCLINLDDGKANAISFDLLEQLNEALDEAQSTGKVVVIAGRPGKFSAGFDLNIMGQGGEPMLDLLRKGAALSARLLGFDRPVVLAASGHALAMGALLLLSADYRIGIQGGYKIGLNEVAIGMTLPYFGVELARGRLAATHLQRAVALAELYDADGAVKAGFLDEAVPGEALVERAAAVASQLSALDMNAHQGSKQRVREEWLPRLQSAIEREFGSG